MKGLPSGYSEAVQLVEKVNDDVTTGDSPGKRDGLGITRLDSALLFQSERQNTSLFIRPAAAHSMQNKK